MRKLMQKLIMYFEVHKLKRDGLKAAQISRHLVLDYRTVKKYLAMSEQEYEGFRKMREIHIESWNHSEALALVR
jgi:hypothetical protein